MSADSLLVNFFYAHPVGHVIEALHYAVGHHAADPDRPVALALNAASPTELAGFCPAVSAAYPVEHPLLEACPDSPDRLGALAGEWGWVCDDFRRHQQVQTNLFPGLGDYYAACDQLLRPRRGRTVVGDIAAGYLPDQPVRLELTGPARDAARRQLSGGRPRLALLPAGSSERWLYPSIDSWLLVLDALHAAMPDLEVVLIGRSAHGERTATSLDDSDHARLLAHPTGPIDGFDRDLAEQLALVEACDVFLSPHSGFGMAALAVETPWLTLSGGRWFEYFFNHVPFRSVLPDPDRWPSFTQFDPAAVATDDDGTARTPSMSRARITHDLDRLVHAAVELIDQRIDYDQALADYFPALLAAHHGDPRAIWSIDAIHTTYI